MLAFTHDVPACRVIFGPGSSDQVVGEATRLGGSRIMLIAGGPEAELAAGIEADLADRIVTRFSDVTMHVPVQVAHAAVAQAQRDSVDVLLSLGGGSATGTAKAVALQTGLPILAVPTTYAGSEMTSIWGLTQDGRKTTGRDPRVLPRTVIYDPVLTLPLPVEVSAASGMNAMAHLVEALYAPGISPVSFLQATEGVRALAASLPRVVADPQDLAARCDALYGAWLAGWALGTTGMGIHHKVCHVLGGAYNLAHAPMHAAVLPYATAYNAEQAPQAMAAVVAALHQAGVPADTAAGGLFDLNRMIGAPTCLLEVGFASAWIPAAAAEVVAGNPNNPRAVDQVGVEGLLEAAVAGERPR